MSSPTHEPAPVAPAPDEGLDHPGTGRPVVLEPTPPGLWGVLLGVGLAALAPLFGFLIGGVLGRGDPAEGSFDPLALSLFIGIVVGVYRKL